VTALRDSAPATLAALAPGDARWQAYVESQASAQPFHHPAWVSMLAEVYGYRPFVLALDDGAGGVAGGLPVMEVRSPLGARRWVSLPFTDYCPPLGPVDAALLDDERLRAGIRRLTVHGPLGGPGGFQGARAVRHVLELQPDPDAVLKTFHRSQVQRNIKKAERSGVVVRRAERAEDLTGVFYRLHLGTRRRLGVPVQPARFFARLWDRVIAPGLGFVLVAEADGVPMASAVFLAYGETVIYKYGASDAGAWGLRPNHAIFWDAIRWSCEAGHRAFDFGRTDLADESLRSFKANWGTEELPLVYSELADLPPSPGSGRSSRILAPVIRRGPTWVGRGIGELLYKYAA
jgi:CelD/BcsL family acetyltransferase involved in cellulose biosynthesis